MGASSVLIDWQIARAFGSSQKEIEVYTAIRYALRCGGSSVGQLLAAIKELELMRPWARAASLPDLCRLARGKVPAIANAIHESIFGPLLEACPERLRPPLANCLAEIPEGTATDIVVYVRELAALLTQGAAQDEADQTLFSLERNEEVSLLLAILEVLVAESPKDVPELLTQNPNGRTRGASPLDFIDRCLDGDFGRTQLVQAVDVYLEMGELHRARVGLNVLSASAEREVDLLHRQARLAYLSSTNASIGDAVGWATKELQLYGELERLARKTLDGDWRTAKLEVTALWQDAVLGIVRLASQQEARSAIGKLLKPRVIQFRNSVVLSLPGRPRQPMTTSLYRDLLWEVGENVNAIRFDVSGLPASHAIAPWFHPDRKRMRPGMPWLPHAPNVFVRMAAWSVLACELLTSKSRFDPEDEGTRYLGYYLLHAYYWLDALDRAFRQGRANVEEGIYHIASAARSVLEQVAGGRYENPTPAFFIQLTNMAVDSGFFSADSPEIDVEDVDRRHDATDRQLETVLVLAQRALAVTEDEPRAGRWLDDAGSLSDTALQWFAGRKRVPTRASNIARCFKRFFEREALPDEAPDKDPMAAVRQHGSWTAVYREHRSVLVKGADRYLDWACGEPQIPLPDQGYAAPLTIAVQRLVAAFSDRSTPPELRDSWVADFRRLLAAATNVSDFDRFLQCRFVEVLQMRLLRDEAELTAMMISRLLEFGSNYTFASLIQWLQKDPVESDIDASLRIQIFETLLRYIRALETARALTEEPQNPESRARHAARARALARLAAASLIPPQQGGQLVNAAILVAARDKRDVELARPLEDRGSQISVEVDDRGLTRSISQSYAAHDLRTAAVVAFDATQLTVRRIGPRQSSPDGRNLFAGAAPDPRSGRAYLGIVVTPREPDTRISFDARSDALGLAGIASTFEQGQLVCADCGPISRGQIASADVRAVRELGPIQRVERWTASTAPRSDSLGLSFRATGPRADLELTQQTTNLLAVFSLRPDFSPFDIRVVVDKEHGGAVPAIGRFTDLLLDEAEQLDLNRDIVLCLRSIIRTERGTISEIEVETAPFRCYRLRPQSDLTEAAAKTLEATFATFGGDEAIAGLFIGTRLTIEVRGPRLALSPEGSSIQPIWSNTPLYAPFDDRNIKWRDLFIASSEEDETAGPLSEPLECSPRQGGRDYLAKLPTQAHVEGFPTTAIVQFTPRPRTGSIVLGMVDRERDGWPYRGALHADEVSASKLTLHGAELKRLVDWLIDGEQERQLRVRTLVRNVSRWGLVRGFTAENLPVQLPAESLSLFPIEDSIHNPIWQRQRDAIGRPHYRRSNVAPRFDVSQVPESAFESGVARGVLSSIPLRNDDPCIVVWRVGAVVEERPLLIENLAEVARRRLDLGCRLTVDKRSMPPALTLEEPRIVAEALWQISDPADPPEPTMFVGTAEIDGVGRRDLFEESPGMIVYAPNAAAAGTMHARFSEAHLAGRSIIGVTDWAGSQLPGTFRHEPVWHLAYEVEGRGRPRAHLCGFSATKKNATGQVRLTGYDLEVEGRHPDGKVRIRRRLRARADENNFRAHVPMQASSPAPRVQVDESQRRQHDRDQLLARWRSLPHIEGRHDNERNIFIPNDSRAQKIFPEGIVIAPSSFSRRSPLAPTSGYSRYRARLVMREWAPLTGSYLDVPAAGIDDLISALGSPPVGTISDVDELALCYVGIDRAPDGKILHLFEWGYGWWARLDPELLRFRGAPIEESELVLAFGDWIKSVRLMVDKERTILSIEETDLAASHVLYKQAKDKILHVLRVSSSSQGDVRIDGLDAFDSRQATSVIRPFPNVVAILDPETAKEIASLLSRKPSEDGRRPAVTVYGRMVTDKFRNTGGTEVVYRAVNPRAEIRSGFDGLQPGDRIFVRAGETRPMSNDLALIIAPLSDVEATAASADSNGRDRKRRPDEWIITRRQFSYDESALARITSGTGSELDNRVLLVRLEVSRRGGFTFIHLNGAPARSSNLMDGLLVQSHGRLFCVFAGRRRGEDAILLEVRPGALIEVERDSVELPQDTLEVGDILRIERRATNTGAPYVAVFAVFNDRRYAKARRPVVALPKNPLRNLTPPFANDRALNEALANFGVADFRQLSSATLDVGLRGAGEKASDALERFMKLPHPKLAWLQTRTVSEGRGYSILSPDFDNSILAGRLEFEPASAGSSSQVPRIRAVPLEAASSKLRDLSIRWSESTFADAPAKRIMDRVIGAGWYYHDRQTIVWRRTSDNRLTPDLPAVERHSIETGPLFFERNGNTATLRFPLHQIERHLIGFANLRGSLPQGKRRLHGVVAYPAPSGGLYAEFLPGRIYELPAALCSSDEQDSIGLDRLDWSVFGTGDRIGLRRAPEQAGRHGQEGMLLWWQHGLRNAFGPHGALMPRVSLDEQSGSVMYGAGRFTITLPTGPTETLPNLAIVGGEGAFRPFTVSDSESDVRRILPPQTTVLLTSQDGENFEIEGLPGFTPAPAASTIGGNEINWRVDSVLGSAISKEEGRLAADWRQIAARIRIVGGALPVTLEAIQIEADGGKKYALFSRRHQNLMLPEGTYARASVVGLVAKSDHVVLAVGGRHIMTPIGRVIEGAPQSLWHDIVESLARANAQVWLRQIGNRYDVGLSDELSSKFAVRCLAAISSKTGETQTAAGLVCVGTLSRRLYWLPAQEIGATRFTPKQLAVAFPSGGPAFEALRLPKAGGISLTRDTRLESELTRLRPGVATSVRPIPGATEHASTALPQFAGPASGKVTLARLTGTGLLISLLLEDNEVAEDAQLSVEIAWRWHDGTALRLIAVRRGRCRTRPDIPSALLQSPAPLLDPTMDIIYYGDSSGSGVAMQFDGNSSTQNMIDQANSLRRERFCGLRTALVVLRRLGENSSDAESQQTFWRLAADLGRRTLRSFHVEPLAKRHATLLRGGRQEDVAPGLNKRVEELLDMVTSDSGSAFADQIAERLEALVLFATLYPQPDRANHLVHALSAALGGRHDLNVLLEGSATIRQLTALLRPFGLPMNTVSPMHRQGLIASTAAACGMIEKHLAEDDFDIPLDRGFIMLTNDQHGRP